MMHFQYDIFDILLSKNCRIRVFHIQIQGRNILGQNDLKVC